ncbi:MAG: hypothetical protein KBA31_02015 [Alphaproteobacteria bacterium]|nr:hypothetical protein [Alphaproteobacteria bacterium]
MFPENYPRTWSEMSFEFKGMFAYHLSIIVMVIAGRGLTPIEQTLIAAALMLAIAVASFIRRLRHEWHWQGVTALRAAGAVLVAALMGYFLFATSGLALQAQGLEFDRPYAWSPFILAGLGIGVFLVLNALRITHLSENTFREECGDHGLQPQPAPPPEPRWKVITRYVFIAAFLAVWLAGVTFFYVYDRTIRASSPMPTVERSVAFNNKGVTVYITPAEKQSIDRLQGFMFIGIPAALAAAFFLQYVLKIRMSLLR